MEQAKAGGWPPIKEGCCTRVCVQVPAGARACWKTPSGVRTACTTCPVPPQVPQVDALVPALMPLPEQDAQPSSRLTSISLLRAQQGPAAA
jgi:hypothetical protein